MCMCVPGSKYLCPSHRRLSPISYVQGTGVLKINYRNSLLFGGWEKADLTSEYGFCKNAERK